jgi:hypothetical protein
VRTAIVSDLHLGSASGADLLRDRSMRELLFAEIAGADRVVLLGDIVELRDLPLAEAMGIARPFFEELGAAMPGTPVVLVPGNHDHHLAEPLLDSAALDSSSALGLEQRFEPSEASALIATWLRPATLELAYPGLWLRDDVYATHGHYVDCHLNLPRAECLAVAAVMRAAGRPPDPATPDDYERVLRPVYGLTYGIAQAGLARNTGAGEGPAERAWRWMGGPEGPRGRRLTAGRLTARTAVPAAVWAINRLLGSDFDSDLSAESVSRGGVAAGAELARRLRIGAAHVITGHTHRAGPRRGEWRIPGGGRLHNTGNWIYTAVFHRGPGPGPYWPGTVTWLEDDGPPRRTGLLADLSSEDLAAAASGLSFRLTSLAGDL